MPAEVVIPAPVGGWNARDALAAMPPADAVTLINWVPGNGIVQGRGGSLTMLDGLGAVVDTLAQYAASGGTTQLLAGYGSTIADVTGFGTPTVLGTGFSNPRWQTAMFDDHMVFVNGQDAPQVYDGSTLAAMTITALATPVIAPFTLGTGTLATGTYFYRVSAFNQNGETLACAETSLAITGPAGVHVNWTTVTGAQGYKIYGRTTGAELLIGTVFGNILTFLDDGSVTPAGALPAANTTAVIGTTLIGVVNFKGRAFYWQANSTDFWYANAGSFQGELIKFPFANFVQKGGYIVQIISWTRDSGDGVDDYCAFVFSTGEILLYQGDDPSIVNQWSMIGRYQMGAPLSVRGHARYASTDIIMTTDGFVGLDEALQNARTELDETFGGKIINAAKLAAQQYATNYGWEAVFYPRASLFLVNIPISATTQQEQYVKNTNTGSWCRFTGWPARTFCVFDDRLYFGTYDGRIVLADVTGADTNTHAYSDNGAPIVYSALTAYQAFGQPGLKSQLTAARVVMNIFDGSALSLNSFVDYRPRSLPPLATPVEQTVGQWDVSFWDDDYWSGPNDLDPSSLDARPILRPITGFGFAIAMSVRYQSLVQNVAWYSSTYIYKQAGVN